VTRRRNPPPRGPIRPQRPGKEREQLESDLRIARANRKAASQEKQRLRRREWDEEVVDTDAEPEQFQYGEPADEEPESTEDESSQG
jgi:hypothetical protein